MADLIIKPTSGNLLIKDDQDATRMTVATSTGNITHTGNIALGTVTAGTIGTGVTHNNKQVCKAWGRIEDDVLTNNYGVSGITVSGAGSATRDYLITMSPAMANDDYTVVTTGYAHETGQVEGLVQWYITGSSDPSTTQFSIRYTGNGTPHIKNVGFAVFGT